ncbi:K(+)-transporting ATPase subunit F [Deinococcus sp. LM3]|uniref:K(+)-transporting ATPase subunit F n=1 Tax=Deinococcus sp. 12RED42 TaxID=2745872 RepID=UPI000993FE4F|nr:K(+)-transporting ATPase subunit F [Deinococcus sp. 12RED42]
MLKESLHGPADRSSDPGLLRPDRARPARPGAPVILFLAVVAALVAAYLVYALLRPEDF